VYTVWQVEEYKIIFKLVINHWTNEILFTDICYADAFRHSESEFFDTIKNIILPSEYFHYKIFIHEKWLEN